MVRKFTISKVLIHHSTKGFTLIELIVGMVIMSIVGGLALNALIEAGKGYSNDKRNIESSQNLSAVLEMVGNDIKQAGEQITENTFPAVVIEPNTDAGSMSGSSKITIRRALAPRLNLCESIPAATSGKTFLIVANDDSVTPTANVNCRIAATTTSTNTNILLSGATTATALAPADTVTRQNSLMTARAARCQLDEPSINYTSFPPTTDFCQPTKPTAPAIDRERVRAAMVDSTGVMWMFDYLDDSVVTIGTNTQHRMTIDRVNPIATPAAYGIDTGIYLIEERIYSLDISGNLQLRRDGETTPQTLISGISNFNISAKIYSNTTTKEINLTPANACTAAQDPDAATSPEYACTFTPSATYNWKTLAGIKVRLQARYDSSGGTTYTLAQLNDPNTTVPEILKLRAAAEFFPRNVLSR